MTIDTFRGHLANILPLQNLCAMIYSIRVPLLLRQISPTTMMMMTVNNYKLLRSLSSSLTSFNRQRHARLVSSFSRPAPPPLPPKQQREFEELVRTAATPASNSQQNNTIDSGAELHPDARRSPSSEFEGDTNPVTGEVNGPKTEPVRHGDWSFGGRASDF